VVFTSENAAQFGSKGGKRGGKARAKLLTAKQRQFIARLGGLAKGKKPTAPKGPQ
jgi:hypothetical protein